MPTILTMIKYNWAVRFIVENAGLVESDRSYNSAPRINNWDVLLLHHVVCRSHLASNLGHKQQADIPFLISPGGTATDAYLTPSSKSFKQWLGSRSSYLSCFPKMSH